MKKPIKQLILTALVCFISNSNATGLQVNRDRIETRIMALAEYGKNPEGGVSRVAYSDADIGGRRYLIGLMREAELQVRIDTAGNVIGYRDGSNLELKPILIGSHADSVPKGGNYDGSLGTIAAIEAVQVLQENNFQTRHPLEVIIFSNEEGALVGSKFFAGLLDEKALSRPSHSGYNIGEGIKRIGGDPTRLKEAVNKPGAYSAFLELHIEQGAILQDQNIDIGVVEGIVGSGVWEVVVEGMANHAGTTPMDKRRDALVGAAELILAVNRLVRSAGHQVGTIGRISAEPGASNVVPGRVVMSLEIRDLNEVRIKTSFDRIKREAQQIAEKNDVKISFYGNPLRVNATHTDKHIRNIIKASADKLGLSSIFMPSGAGHDAQSIAVIAPIGMIFVPSVDGISHSPKEFTTAGDMANGANVLLHSLLALDRKE